MPDEYTAEVWKRIPSLAGYEASNLGRIRSHRGWKRGGPHVMSQNPFTRFGHLGISVQKDGKTRLGVVHRLVLEAFYGLAPTGHECCHRDGDASNNNISNLRWGTRTENAADRKRHGTDPSGERNPRAKLNWKAVREMRAIRDRGEMTPALRRQYAAQFSVGYGVINKAIRGHTWREE